MKSKTLMLGALIALVCAPAPGVAGDVNYEGMRISGPYTYKNLAVFFIHGQDNIQTENLLTLEEAIEEGKLIVYETGSVGELMVENVSDEPVFIQAGDIVKGGRQDRTLQHDLIVEGGSGKIAIASFCVEKGRWSQRGGERSDQFGSSESALASKELKLAVRGGGSQGEVWYQVDDVRAQLEDNIGKPVENSVSSSSLQLTLENNEVQIRATSYIDTMMEAARDRQNLIGFAFAINDELNCADIYRSSDLFWKLWPKLIEACAIEALAKLRGNNELGDITVEDVAGWLGAAEMGKETRETINKHMVCISKESDAGYLFITAGIDNEEQWIHKSLISK